MKIPAVQQIADGYGQARLSEIGQFELCLFQHFGEEPLIPQLVAAFPLVRRASGRAAILFRLLRHSRRYPQVTSLAIAALADRAYLVRESACSMLAYSLKQDALPALRALGTHADQELAPMRWPQPMQLPNKTIITMLIALTPVQLYGKSAEP